MSEGAQPLPEPPYYAVIFYSERSGPDPDYERTAARMLELAREQPGFLGVESARDEAGVGMTVSYWRTSEDIACWKAHAEHREAQARGRSRWYSRYVLRVALVERAWEFSRPE